MKIRGTPAHIAEKYMSLARDASSSSDPVLAENYLQHAEHYNRIIMAFRDQQLQQGGEMNGAGARNRAYGPDSMEPGDEYSDDDDDMDGLPHQQPMRPNEPQPRIDAQRFESPRGGDQRRYRDRPERRADAGGGGGFQARPQSADAGADNGASQAEGPPRRRERFAASHEQPEFLRRPVRRPRRESAAAAGEANGGAVAEDTDGE